MKIRYLNSKELDEVRDISTIKQIAELDNPADLEAVLLIDDSGKTLLFVTSEWAWISEVTEK